MIRLLAAGLMAVLATQPAAAHITIGNGNTVFQDGKIKEARNGVTICPSNCIASITSVDGVIIGNNNKIMQIRRINGVQTATSIGGRHSGHISPISDQ